MFELAGLSVAFPSGAAVCFHCGRSTAAFCGWCVSANVANDPHNRDRSGVLSFTVSFKVLESRGRRGWEPGGKSCPQTAPCSLMTVQLGHAVDTCSSEQGASPHLHLLRLVTCAYMLVYVCEIGASFLRWHISHGGHGDRKAPGRHNGENVFSC